MAAYYNEFDPKAAAWLRELIRKELIADGEVDERSILDVSAEDLIGFTQCHFFAGIGGWSYALRLSGFPDDQPVWTGSPPCQPFSSAGQKKGKDDERHLGPHFAHLVATGRPPIIFGEQVASSAVFGKVAKKTGSQPDGTAEWAWINDLQDRLEAAHYAIGVSDIPAAGVGAPHIRQRTFFGAVGLAQSDGGERDRIADGERRKSDGTKAGRIKGYGQPERSKQALGLDDTSSARHVGSLGRAERDTRDETRVCVSGERRREDRVADADSTTGRKNTRSASCNEEAHGRERRHGCGSDGNNGPTGYGEDSWSSPLDGFWQDADWLFCRDGKWRPVEPGTFPLAHGVSARVGRLRGYGNAIVPQAAALFINSFLDSI